MKRLRLLLLASFLAACAPALPSAPISSPTEQFQLATIDIKMPTDAPTRPPLPTQPGTPTRKATPTLPALPTPTGVTFKFDDGVPQDQRDTIITGIAMARAYLGESRPMTIFAFADLNGQMDEVSRYFNEPRTSARLRSIQQYLQADRANAYPHAMFFPMSKARMARVKEDRLRTIAHEYFHAVEGFLTNTDPFNYSVPTWLYEGTAEFAAFRVLSHYGYYDLNSIHKDRIERTRGIVSPISTMEVLRISEREDLRAHYDFGYLADEMLTEIAGEQAVLRKFWENYPKYPDWRQIFKATFGIADEEFYRRFEETRRAQFPPYCGTLGAFATPAPNEPFAIKLIRRDPPGALVFPSVSWTLVTPAPTAYTFCITGYPLVSLTDKVAAFKLPAGNYSWVSCGGNCIVLYMRPTAAPGPYTFAIELPDKRRAEVQFQHSIPPAGATPEP